MADIEPSNELAGFASMEDEQSFIDIDHEDGANSPEEEKTSGEGTQPAEQKQPIEDPKQEGADKEDQEKPLTEEDTPATKEEPMIPYHRFKESREELRQLKEEVATLRGRSPVAPSRTEEVPEDLDAEKYLERKLEQVIERREELLSKKDEREATELTELMGIYGGFDVDKVLDIKDEFKKADAILSNEAALKIYFERGQSKTSNKKEISTPASKPAIPQPQQNASRDVAPTTKPDLSKPLSKIIEEAKKEYGLIK